ncbi:Xylose isomerase domain-containing protein TIM barrel [Pseudopedobacter saltans DSM 12145]|uniref:Xylose isomerase domain-containing protein TIM barrel n=1 Tax=Pseudopedobacter saltans (strain ATCC 51119 / DSM 12145 / JCM 21818 / CCUG 39354 / LMG 10337 / NBRC 100064 / NCIMB 13643) TaxID=762903 RepID=F0SB93_PSESL|nr:sugar phosphate isomerase/epimerase [Pseudopedobacter saltans]ADY53720.1 Xylose isomerase domain-containing protein TIM barrel [Pseudopedobacter saltans DSM 12145]
MNTLRRSFLICLSLVLSLSILANAKTQPRAYGLQLYSLRNEFGKRSVEDIISQVSKAGYSFVEPYGYSKKNGFWGLSPKNFKKLLDKYKLTTQGGHYEFGFLEKGTIDHDVLEDYISVAKTLNQKYIIVPHINKKIFDSEAKVKEFAGKLKVVSEIFRKAGLKLAYHNHDFEFNNLGGNTGYEILLKELKSSEMEFEIDLYWAVRANQNIDALFKEYPGRFTMWHIKDIRKSDETKNTEIGNGTIDYKKILKEAKLAGLKYAIVEQENFEIDPFESINRSIKYLKSIQ